MAALVDGRNIGPLVRELGRDTAFNAAASDARFALLFKALKGEASLQPAPVVTDEAGKTVASIRKGASRTTFVVDDRLAPAFGEFLIRQLPELYETYRRARQQDG